MINKCKIKYVTVINSKVNVYTLEIFDQSSMQIKNHGKHKSQKLHFCRSMLIELRLYVYVPPDTK